MAAGIEKIYDTKMGGVRVVKARLMGHDATFTCNEALGHCTVQVDATGPLAPDIGYSKGRFAMTYAHVTVTPETAPLFEAAYADARKFCEEAGPCVSAIRAAIEDGRPIP